MHIGGEGGGEGQVVMTLEPPPPPLQIFKKLVNLNATKREIEYALEIFYFGKNLSYPLRWIFNPVQL